MLRRMWNSFLWVETWVRTLIFTIWHFFLPITQHTSSSVTPPESSAWEESHSILSKHGQDHDKVLERVHLIIYFSEHRKQQIDFNEPCECFFAKPQFDIIPQAFQGACPYLPSSPSTFFPLCTLRSSCIGLFISWSSFLHRGRHKQGSLPQWCPPCASPPVLTNGLLFPGLSFYVLSPERPLCSPWPDF